MTVIVPEVDLGEVEFIDDLVVRLIEANSQQSRRQIAPPFVTYKRTYVRQKYLLFKKRYFNLTKVDLVETKVAFVNKSNFCLQKLLLSKQNLFLSRQNLLLSTNVTFVDQSNFCGQNLL